MRGRGHEELFHGHRISVGEDEHVLEMDGRAGCAAMRMYLVQLNCKPKNGKFYVMYFTIIFNAKGELRVQLEEEKFTP